MTEWIVKTFIKNHDKVTEPTVRTAYGKLASTVGIFCNVLLFAGKLLAGLITGSIAIMADAVNNLSDASGNIVSLAGFKLAAKAPDQKHPYGYARYEYLAGLTVSAMILAIGFSLCKESVIKIYAPAEILFSWLSMGILASSIAVKLWMSHFNKVLGDKINSDTLKATAADSRNDVISTGAVLVSSLIGHYTGIARIDGIMGLLVAIFIIYSGFNLVRETMSPLLGESPDPELVTMIEKKVMSYPGVLGIHDLMVHDYGPGHKFASLHLEMPAENDAMASHDLIDNIENDFLKNDKLLVSIHFDPIITADSRVSETRMKIAAGVHDLDSRLSIHDLRMVVGPTHTNVLFDLAFPADFRGDIPTLVRTVEKIVTDIDSKYIPKVKAEQSFVTK